MTPMKHVVILGAGNAGLFASLILKKNRPGLSITVVGSKEIGIVGVGESSTEHIQFITKALGITASEMCANTGSTFKFGVYLDWQKEPWVHALFAGNQESVHAYNQHQLYQTFAVNAPKMAGIPTNCLNNMVHPDQTPNQFHFDTYLLNNYLIEQCNRKGIQVIDDKVTEFNFREDGTLESIESETSIYTADFFIDASGFARLLSKQVDEFQWVSQQHNLFCDKAFAFPTEHKDDNYGMFTNAVKMKAGWMWQIPVHHRQGNGYVYSSKYTTYEEAVAEVEEKLGHPIEVMKTFDFEAGHFNKTLHKNMCLIGLASHFFEPLEATSMGVGINQARILTNYICQNDYGDNSMQDGYNREVQKMFKQMWTFIRLHYHNAVPDSPFWEHVASTKLPDEVQKLVDIAKTRMLNSNDMDCHIDWYIFHELNFNQVLYCIDELSPEVAADHVMACGEFRPVYTDIWELPADEQAKVMKHKDYIDGLIDGSITPKKSTDRIKYEHKEKIV